LYELEGEFNDEEKINNLVSLTGIFPIHLVLDKIVEERLAYYKVPPLGEWDNDLGVAWFIPREVIPKKTKNGKTYWIVRVVDNTSTVNSIKCWGVKPEKDEIHLNHPYMSKLDYDEDWGFSTRSIKYNFKMLG
jgi:hypothetical protein